MRVLFVSEQRPPRPTLLTVLQQVLQECGWTQIHVTPVRFSALSRRQPDHPYDLAVVDATTITSVVAEAVRHLGDYEPKVQVLGFVGHDKMVSQPTPRLIGCADACLMLSAHQLKEEKLYAAFFRKHIHPPETARAHESELAEVA